MAVVMENNKIVSCSGVAIVPDQCFYYGMGNCGKKGIGMDSYRWPKCEAKTDCGFRSNAAAIAEIMRPRSRAEIEVEILERWDARVRGVEFRQERNT